MNVSTLTESPYTVPQDALAVHAATLIADITDELLPRVAAELAMYVEAPEGQAANLVIAEALKEHLIAFFARPGLTKDDLANYDSIRRILLGE